MAGFYDKMASLAATQIKDKGRLVTLRRVQRTRNPVTGKSTKKTTDTPVYAVFTEIEEDRIDGEVIKIGDKELLVAAQGLDAKPANSDIIVDDDGSQWHVTRVKETKPGPLAVLYKLVSRR